MLQHKIATRRLFQRLALSPTLLASSVKRLILIMISYIYQYILVAFDVR
uniref:Uncharacterized protein n=1 Tax=Siphoviridae sp. ct37J14 TaxID=2826280 RepID=A0A8S5M0M6_9CAUD|nr:MAG TPA: hypothetical protein [Siphoviridae sp. ct37J14]